MQKFNLNFLILINLHSLLLKKYIFNIEGKTNILIFYFPKLLDIFFILYSSYSSSNKEDYGELQ